MGKWYPITCEKIRKCAYFDTIGGPFFWSHPVLSVIYLLVLVKNCSNLSKLAHTFSEQCPLGTFQKGDICCDGINEVNLNGFCQTLCDPPTNYVLNETTNVCECANNFNALNPLNEESGRLCCPQGQVSSVNSRGFPECADQCPKNYVANAKGKFYITLSEIDLKDKEKQDWTGCSVSKAAQFVLVDLLEKGTIFNHYYNSSLIAIWALS